jgi:hypothetical protein
MTRSETRLIELRVEHPRGFAHQSAIRPGAGEHAVKRTALFASGFAFRAIRRRTATMAQRIAIADTGAGALGFGNKIVRRFLRFRSTPSPRSASWRAQKRRRDDGGNGVRERTLIHLTYMGMNSIMGIVSEIKNLSD